MFAIVIGSLLSAFIFFVETTYLPPSRLGNEINANFNHRILNRESEESALSLEDTYLNITQLARKYGYSIEEHKVMTEDGYILGLHRLTKRETRTTNRTPVFLMHGLLDSSDSWVLQGPKTALPYLLFDEGYDVWMGNARGNKYSMAHIYLQPNQGQFWKFSWEEIGTTMCKMTSNCNNVFEMIFGNNYYVNKAMLPIILGHSPSSSSVLQFVHFGQLHSSGRFCRFDYGFFGNLNEYNTFSPPDYDLYKITVPIVLFSSGNDWLSHPLDVETLETHLPNVYKSYYSTYFNHIDYLYAGVAKEAIYMKIIEEIQNFEMQL